MTRPNSLIPALLSPVVTLAMAGESKEMTVRRGLIVNLSADSMFECVLRLQRGAEQRIVWRELHIVP